MLFSRHLIFASLKFRDFLNREIREINVSRKFHVIRYKVFTCVVYTNLVIFGYVTQARSQDFLRVGAIS